MYYTSARKVKDETGKIYFDQITHLPPDIPLTESDTYIEVGVADRLDLLAEQFYNGQTDMYRVIILANELEGNSLYLEPGSVLRIPAITKDQFLDLIENYNYNI